MRISVLQQGAIHTRSVLRPMHHSPVEYIITQGQITATAMNGPRPCESSKLQFSLVSVILQTLIAAGAGAWAPSATAAVSGSHVTVWWPQPITPHDGDASPGKLPKQVRCKSKTSPESCQPLPRAYDSRSATMCTIGQSK